jgi:P-type E1-E2 ATPase
VAEEGIDLEPLGTRVTHLEEAGQTVIAVGRDGRVLGLVAFGDPLRSEARETVAALQQAGLTVALVTGDNERTARRLAHQVGIETVHAGVLPARKAEIVRQFQAEGRVAMVGDGINDAPALVCASLVAME